MPQSDAAYWDSARRARDKLVNEYLQHPDVNLIDMGYPPESGGENQAVVLRIHVVEHWFRLPAEKRVAFPAEVDGFRVVVVPGTYKAG